MKNSKGKIYFGDNLELLKTLEDESVDLIYIDPPFNTGKKQARKQIKTEQITEDDKESQAEEGDRVGFGGKKYKTTSIMQTAFADAFDDFYSFLEPRLLEAHRVLKPEGSMYFHIDPKEVHYCKVMLDGIFGRKNFMNEIIWAYDYGGRAKDRWPAKHDNILLYAKDVKKHFFSQDAVEKIPYMAPGMVSKEKREKGKMPTDTWWHTIVATNGKEKTGYATQKPLGVLRRCIMASSKPGDTVLDFFAGSGTTGYSAHELERNFILMDQNEQSMQVIAKRFPADADIEWIGFDPTPFQEELFERNLF